MRLTFDARAPLVFDIETLPLDNAADYLDPVEPDKRLVDPVKIEISRIERTKARDERLCLDPNVGRIAIIGWWTENEMTVYGCETETDEARAITEFWRAIRQRVIVGFNIKGFDLPFLIQRSRYLDITHPPLDIGRYSREAIVDLFLELTFNQGHQCQGEMRHSLRAFAKRFGIACDDPVEGKDVPALIAAGDWQSAIDHCKSDLRCTVQLAQRLNLVPVEALVA